MARWARRIGKALALLVGALALLLVGAVVLTPDATPPDDAHLEAERLSLAPAENAFTHLEEGSSALVWPEDAAPRASELRRDAPAPRRAARRLLARNGPALAALDRALAAPAMQLPAPSSPEELAEGRSPVTVDRAFEWQRLAKLVRLRSGLALARGEEDEAAADAARILHLGERMIAARGGDLTTAWMGVAIQGIGLGAFGALAERGALDAGHSRRFAASIEAHRPAPEAWARVWASEYRTHRSAILWTLGSEERTGSSAEMAPPDRKHVVPWWARPLARGYAVQPNRTLAGFAADYGSLHEAAGAPCASAPEPSPPFFPSSSFEQARMLLAPNGVGRLLRSFGMPGLARIRARRCAFDSRVASVKARLGLSAYERAHSELPATLEALVPRYLEAVPRDGFDGAPLRYRPDARLLYSVGRDLRDGGGRPESDPSDLEEPTFPVDAPARAACQEKGAQPDPSGAATASSLN